MMLIHKCICAKIVHSLGSFLRGVGLLPSAGRGWRGGRRLV